MPYDPNYKVCKEWLKTGDCPVFVQYKDQKLDGSPDVTLRVGYATADDDVLFLRRSRWLDLKTLEWRVSKLPVRKKPEIDMSIGSLCSILIRAALIQEMFFLEPALWIPWLDCDDVPT